MKAVITDCSWGSLDIEKKYLPSDFNISAYKCRSEGELIEVCHDADAIFAGYAPITRGVLENLKNCKIISINGTGSDNVDLEAASEFKIDVANVPDYCSHEVADHTMALLLAVNRNIVSYQKRIEDRIWNINAAAPMTRLSGQTIGLIGFGQIAQKVAQRARNFGLKVIAYSPSVSSAFAASFHVELLGLEDILSQADIISVHLPLRENTIELFNEEKFAMMKKKPIFINTSRGKVVNEKDLIKALKKGMIKAVALDVLAEEPPDFTSELFQLENVIITPHAGYYSETALEEVRRRSALNVANYFNGKYNEINFLNK